MKTDLITINNQGMGFPAALKECRKAAGYRKLEKKPASVWFWAAFLLLFSFFV